MKLTLCIYVCQCEHSIRCFQIFLSCIFISAVFVSFCIEIASIGFQIEVLVQFYRFICDVCFVYKVKVNVIVINKSDSEFMRQKVETAEEKNKSETKNNNRTYC